jgi:hypothetical protein
MLKLIRDWREKFSVGSLLVAVYQATTVQKGLLAAMLGITALLLALYLAKRGV